MRVVIAEDSLLLREGLVALLREHEIEVVAQAEDGEGLLRIVGGHKPDLAIVDVRLPPSFTDEGIRAAVEARRRHPGPRRPDPLPVRRAGLHGRAPRGRRGRRRLPAEGAGRRHPRLPRRRPPRRRRRHRPRPRGRRRAGRRAPRRGDESPLDALSPREREVLSLMAEGRTNNAIAEALVVTPGAVEKHVSNIFGKLNLPRRRRRPPAGAGRAGVPAGDGRGLSAAGPGRGRTEEGRPGRLGGGPGRLWPPPRRPGREVLRGAWRNLGPSHRSGVRTYPA